MALEHALMSQILQVAAMSCTNAEAKDVLSKAMEKFGPHMSAYQRKQVVVASDGQTGLVYSTKSRTTGTRTDVVLTEVMTSEEEAVDGKYTVICVDHGTCVLCHNLQVAKAVAAHPDDFCDECREALQE